MWILLYHTSLLHPYIPMTQQCIILTTNGERGGHSSASKHKHTHQSRRGGLFSHTFRDLQGNWFAVILTPKKKLCRSPEALNVATPQYPLPPAVQTCFFWGKKIRLFGNKQQQQQQMKWYGEKKERRFFLTVLLDYVLALLDFALVDAVLEVPVGLVASHVLEKETLQFSQPSLKKKNHC